MADDTTGPVQKPLPRVGSYKLLKALGAGGMSSVFHAVHEQTGLEVALKILPRTLAKNPTLLQRFIREAKSAEALEHPNIVAIYDRGVDEGRHYLALEYVRGGDLHDRVRSGGPMSTDEARHVIKSVAEGLKFAESRGLIHRDIKPANILLTEDGGVKVADLGLALQAESEDERVTREGTTVGTVDYMAPEQARDSRATSIRSDIYSLGCTYYFLLTGQPPFAGGEVPDKLARHFLSPPPDPRDFRPELPEALVNVLHKMMAKRPDQRFGSYDALSQALDAIPAPGTNPTLAATALPAPSPLFALVDDDSEEASDSGLPELKVLESLPDQEAPALPLFTMAELAELDEDGPPPRASASSPSAQPSLPQFGHPYGESDSSLAVGVLPAGAGRAITPAERSWIMTWVLLGLGCFFAVVGADLLVRGTSTSGREGGEQAPGDGEGKTASLEGADRGLDTIERRLPKAKELPPARKVAGGGPIGPPSQAVGWIEPPDPPRLFAAEPVYSRAMHDRYISAWGREARDEVSPPPGLFILVNRMAGPLPTDPKPSVRAALDTVGGAGVEIACNGPFFEDDLKFVGESRVIRASPGFRPVIVLERSRRESELGRAAFLDIGEKSLRIEGIDLVLDRQDFPGGLAALFLCRGGALTLRDCTVTVVNRSNAPLSLIQTGPSVQTSRLRLERTILRGTFGAALELGAGPVEAALDRSLVFNGGGCGVLDTAAAERAAEHRVALVQSLICCKGAAVERLKAGAGPRSRGPSLRSLGSTYAHFQAPTQTFLLAARGESPGSIPTALFDWQGDANAYYGWAGFLGSGRNQRAVITGLAAARTAWKGTDPASLEHATGWPEPPTPEWVLPDQLRPFALAGLPTLTKLPAPTNFLGPRTVEAFAKPQVPGLRTGALDGPSAPAVQPVGFLDGRIVGAEARLTPAAGGGQGRGPLELTFDTKQATGGGDLGAFLAAHVREEDRWVRVKVLGSGEHPCSPYKVPDGITLEVRVETTEGLTPSWVARGGSAEGSLFSAHGGHLGLSGVRLSRDAASNLSSLVRVDSGHLVVHRCRLMAHGVVGEGGGRLIDFVAPTTQPLAWGPESPSLFDAPVDRPTCRVSDSVLITGGEAIRAELGRGLVALTQSALAAGEAVVALVPSRVARSRFDCDLVMERCTLAGERAVVRSGAWPGTAPGPDRPWLVSSVACAFFGTYERPRDATLLRADPRGFAQGVVFWQANQDAYDMPVFLASPNAVTPATRRPDVRWHWIDLWGANHVRNVTGPRISGGGGPGVRLLAKLRSGEVLPGDLALDPDFPPGRGPANIGADLARIGVATTPPGSRRR